MDKITFDNINDLLVKETMLNLKGNLLKNLPDVVDFKSLDITQHDDFYEVFVMLKRQLYLESYIDSLEKSFNLNILLASRKWDKSQYKLIAYHRPLEGEMYAVFIDSVQYGLIDSITFRVYDSIEIMLYNLQSEKKKIPQDWNVLEHQNYKEMLSLFV